MNAAIGVFALLLLAVAPSPAALVAGSVRDQHGAPISGAHVVLRNGDHDVGEATTAQDGTFIFSGAATQARITCSYCAATTSAIDADGIVTSVVHRYDAVRNDGPSAEDISHLPSANAPALLQLEPFVVVNDTSRTIPGVSATDRNATPYGGLLVLDGVPDYDLTADVTSFNTIPQGGASELTVLRVDDAYRYGNLAQGGTFLFDTPGGASWASAGNNQLVRGAFNNGETSGSLSYSNAGVGDRSERATFSEQLVTPGSVLQFTASSGSGYRSPQSLSALFSSFSSAFASVRSRGKVDAFADMLVDRGTYDYTSVGFPASSIWSDVELSAGVDSHAILAPFVHFDVRQSSGAYSSSVTGPDSVDGWLSQARTSAGLAYTSPVLDATVAGGLDNVVYTSIVGPGQTDPENANDSVASFTLRPAPQWSLHASASTGYTLQTFLGIYVPFSAGLPYRRPVIDGHTNEAILEYTDSARLRVALTTLAWGSSPGMATSSAGASVAWQIAPKLSLRTWLLRAQSTAAPQSTVGSAWLTYENAAAFRADVMWGRSLVDRVAQDGINASVAGRLSDRLDWFVTSARFDGTRQTSAGVRIR
jgi:hypothetical protein